MRDWNGHEVVLLESRWHAHIAIRHPEVAGYLDRIPEVLARPNLTVVVRYKRHVGEVLTVYVPIALTGGIGRLIYADR